MKAAEFTSFGWRPIACAEADARLWVGDVAADAAPPDAALTLSRDEIDRANRFLRAEDRAHFMLTRSALRHLLAKAAGVSPEKIIFALGPYGKPFLAGREDLHFNASHSGGLALIGISPQRPIGVDIELMRETIDELALSEAFFSTAEHRFLSSLEGPARRTAFYKIWTCKEAVLKAFGLGITDSLKTFQVRLRPEGVDLQPEPDCFTPSLTDVRARLVDVPGGCAAAYAFA